MLVSPVPSGPSVCEWLGLLRMNLKPGTGVPHIDGVLSSYELCFSDKVCSSTVNQLAQLTPTLENSNQ